MNRSETLQLLAALKELDPQNWATIGETTIAVWMSVMNREPAIPAGAAMLTAFEIAARPGQKVPAPGDFRALVAEVVCKLPGVDEAKKQIERSMRENYPGMPARYTPDRIVLDAVRDIGGIHVFRVAQSEQETAALWRRFTARYGELRTERLDTIDYAAAYAQLASGETEHIRALGNGERRSA